MKSEYEQNAAQRHVEESERLAAMLREFSSLFKYDESNDRSIAIVGPAFIDTLLTSTLRNLMVPDSKEVERVLQPDGPAGTFSAKVSMCYALGLIGQTITADLRLVGKIRNRFAHELAASFEETKVKDWCFALRWHRESLMADAPQNATARDIYQVGINQLVCYLNILPSIAYSVRAGIAGTWKP